VGGQRHVGAFVLPVESDEPLPLVVFNHGGNEGVSLEDDVFPFIDALDERGARFAYVVPAYRSETLDFGPSTFTAGGEPSPWDGDVDDALALLNAAIEHIEQADATRIASVGFSRGAAVGNLMAIRDERIDQTISFFAPTDFYGPFGRQVIERALQGIPSNLPGTEVLIERFILPLQRGDLEIDDVRPELTRRSATVFADRIPAIQVHHGEDDPIVPLNEASQLNDALAGTGRTPEEGSDYELFLYTADPPYETELNQHNANELTSGFERAGDFLSRLLPAQEALVP